jgi:hypothetical protein
MKITNRNNNTKRIIAIVVAIICIAAISLAVYWYLSHRNGQQTGTNKVNLNPPTQEEKQAGTSAKQQAVERDQAIKNNDSTSTTNPSSSSLSVDITASNKTSSLIQIRVQINSIVNSGTCDITLTNGASSVHHSAAISPLASTSTCKGFDIPLSELSPGKWNYTITVKDTSTNQTGAASGTVSI